MASLPLKNIKEYKVVHGKPLRTSVDWLQVMRLNGTGEAIDAHEYPATSEELIEQYGEQEIEIHDDTETLGEVLGRLGADTYADADDVREALFSALSAGAVGRRFYSDRDPGTPGEGDTEQVSF